MSTRFHIGANGPERCKAEPGNCPLAEWGSLYEAEKAHQQAMSEELGTFSTVSKRGRGGSGATPLSEERRAEFLAPVEIAPDPKRNLKADALTSHLMSETMDLVLAIEATKDFYLPLLDGQVPERFPARLSRDTHSPVRAHLVHGHLCDTGYFARVTKETASDIADHIGPDAVVLDPMAGKGYASKALREAGVPTISYDREPWQGSSGIEAGDAVESLRKHGHETTHLLLAWTPHGSGIDRQMAEVVAEDFPHITIINIGEYSGGCTGSNEFWDVVDRESGTPPNIRYTNLPNLSDHVEFLRVDTGQ